MVVAKTMIVTKGSMVRPSSRRAMDRWMCMQVAPGAHRRSDRRRATAFRGGFFDARDLARPAVRNLRRIARRRRDLRARAHGRTEPRLTLGRVQGHRWYRSTSGVLTLLCLVLR